MAPANATISRRCGGTYSEGASWDEVDYSQCRFTSITLKLCEASLVSGCHDQSTENVWLRPQQVKCLYDLSLVPRPLVKFNFCKWPWYKASRPCINYTLTKTWQLKNKSVYRACRTG